MTSHMETHEELLRDVVVGDLAPDDPAVRERIESCPECRRLLEGTLRATELLEQDRAEQEELLALAASLPDAPVESVEAMRDHPEIRQRWGPDRGPSWLRAGPIAALLALAAAVLAIFMLVPRDGGEPDTELGPRMLGDPADLLLLEPRGVLDDYGTFAWQIDPELEDTVAYYTVIIQSEGQRLREVARTRQPRWTPGAGELPAEIEWWVEAYGAGDVKLARSEPASARRSP